MRLLLDENVPKPLHDALLTFLFHHKIVHLLDISGWSGTKDQSLYRLAAEENFDVVITNDSKQMQRPLEVAAIASAGIHRVEYPHKHGGLAGLGLAIATVCAGLPRALEALEDANGQRLIKLAGIDPTPASRFRIIDPKERPPKFWPTSSEAEPAIRDIKPAGSDKHEDQT